MTCNDPHMGYLTERWYEEVHRFQDQFSTSSIDSEWERADLKWYSRITQTIVNSK